MTLGFVLAVTLQAAQPAAVPDLAPGARYDPKIPTLQQVVGHDFGLEITPPEQIVIYLANEDNLLQALVTEIERF